MARHPIDCHAINIQPNKMMKDASSNISLSFFSVASALNHLHQRVITLSQFFFCFSTWVFILRNKLFALLNYFSKYVSVWKMNFSEFFLHSFFTFFFSLVSHCKWVAAKRNGIRCILKTMTIYCSWMLFGCVFHFFSPRSFRFAFYVSN